MRSRVCLFASAFFILLINTVPPAVIAAPIWASADACLLLSQAEVSAAVGVPMDPGRHEAGASNECSWRPHLTFDKDGKWVRNVNHLQLWVETADQENITRVFEWEKFARGQENVTSAPHLGDDAYYAHYGLGATDLIVRKGLIVLRILAIGPTDRQTVMDADKTIAAQLLSSTAPPAYIAACYGGDFLKNLAGMKPIFSAQLDIPDDQWPRLAQVLQGVSEHDNLQFFNDTQRERYISMVNISICSSHGLFMSAYASRHVGCDGDIVNDVCQGKQVTPSRPLRVDIFAYNDPASWNDFAQEVEASLSNEWPGELKSSPESQVRLLNSSPMVGW
jgi:hypothetical protein